MSLPTGSAVAFLFTDIEGSTRLERAVGSAQWAAVVARHDALLRGAIEGNGGVVVKTEGDAFFAAFARASGAARAAVDAQRALAAEPWPAGAPVRVRMGLHLGEGRLRQGLSTAESEDYVGIDVNHQDNRSGRERESSHCIRDDVRLRQPRPQDVGNRRGQPRAGWRCPDDAVDI